MEQQLLDIAKKLSELGLNRGTSGNCSVRTQDEQIFLITPSGISIEHLQTEHMVKMNLQGEVVSGGRPSSEWRFHRDIFLHRPEVNAVIHTHSTFATALSCLRKDIPAFHYMIAVAGGNSIRCSPYAIFGSQELSDNALQALQDRRACLLGNHGMIATGKDLESALALTVEVETLCQQYAEALKMGDPILLDDEKMQAVLEKFKTYGVGSSQVEK